MRLCPCCLEHFLLLEKENRCSKCFAETNSSSSICPPCREKKSPFKKIVACFDTLGPASTLAKAYLHRGYTNLAKEIASMLYLQLVHCNFPEFDCVTTIPVPFKEPLEPIGQELALLCGAKYQPLLKRKWTPRYEFAIKNQCAIINQKVLLLDLFFIDKEPFERAGWTLYEENPEQIYGIVWCTNK